MKVINVPSINGLKKTIGCNKAPDKILAFIEEFHLNEDGMLPFFNVDKVSIDNSNVEENNKNIYQKIEDSLKETDKVIALGGDHSITYPCFKAFSENFDNPGIIIFDAHPDCMQDFSPPTHEDFVKVLIDERSLKKENVVLVGLRNWHKDEYKFLKENKIKFFNMKEIIREGLLEASDSIMSIARRFSSLYVSIDIDVIDPAFAPGTGYPEPAGLTSRELLYFLNRIKLMKNLKMIDLVEVNPDKDINDMTSRLAAKIVSELL